MRSITTRRTAAAIAAVICMAIPTTVHADSDAAQLPGAQTTPIPTSTLPEPAFPSADFRGGDNPADHPGMSRAQPAPTTIEVVRPERTIVRDVDEALPIALAGAALLLALCVAAGTLVRGRLAPRPGRIG